MNTGAGAILKAFGLAIVVALLVGFTMDVSVDDPPGYCGTALREHKGFTWQPSCDAARQDRQVLVFIGVVAGVVLLVSGWWTSTPDSRVVPVATKGRRRTDEG